MILGRNIRELRNAARQISRAPLQAQISRRKLPKQAIVQQRPSAVIDLYEFRLKLHTTAYGTATTKTAHTYDIYAKTGEMIPANAIIENVGNVIKRANVGRYLAATNGSYAIVGYYQGEDVSDPASWLIFSCDEREDVVICNAAAPAP